MVGHLSPHIKNIVSFPSGLEYLHQAGSANIKPGYLYVIFLLFFLVALTFFFMWSLWSYHGTLGHVCSSELRKKKSFQILFSLFLGLQTKVSNHLASSPPGGLCALKSLVFLLCFHAAINLLLTLANCFSIPNSVFISRNHDEFLCLQFFFFCSHILIS